MVEIRSDVFPPATHTDEPNGTTPVTTNPRWRSLAGLSAGLEALFAVTVVAVLGLGVATVVLGATLDDAEGAVGFGPFVEAVDTLDVYFGIMALLLEPLLWPDDRGSIHRLDVPPGEEQRAARPSRDQPHARVGHRRLVRALR